MTVDALDAAILSRGGAARVAARARQKAASELAAHEPLEATPGSVTDVAAALGRWIVTDEQVQEMQATRLIWRDVIAHGHLGVWSAPGGGGKTTLARFAAGELAADGFEVFFFQEDAGAGDLPMLHQHAKDNGYFMLNSTLAGSSPEDQLDVLEGMVQRGTRLDNVVLFLDTLKKYLDLMSKRGSRQFFQLQRSLTQLGCTVILLGHTNKHKGMDGKPVFEGVGDVRNDVDELIYLDATDKDAAGMVTVTMRPDKVRCAVKERSFQLNTRTLEVRPLDEVIDVASLVEARQRLEQDRPLIEAVTSALSGGGMNYTDLLQRVMDSSGSSRTTVRKVVDRYMSEDLTDPKALWIETRLRTNNARYISLRPGGLPAKAGGLPC